MGQCVDLRFFCLQRSLVLFALGVALTSLGNNRLETLRVMGVLQRLGAAYLVAASLAVLMTPRRWGAAAVDAAGAGAGAKNGAGPGPGPLADVVALLPQWVVVLALAAGHLAAQLLLNVPGCPRGYMGPGGVHLDAAYTNCTGGAAGFVDRLVLGEEHLYQMPGSRLVYGSGPFDPEGLLGECMPSPLQPGAEVHGGAKFWPSPILCVGDFPLLSAILRAHRDSGRLLSNCFLLFSPCRRYPDERLPGVPGRPGGQRPRHLPVLEVSRHPVVLVVRPAGRRRRLRLVLRRHPRQQEPLVSRSRPPRPRPVLGRGEHRVQCPQTSVAS